MVRLLDVGTIVYCDYDSFAFLPILKLLCSSQNHVRFHLAPITQSELVVVYMLAPNFLQSASDSSQDDDLCLTGPSSANLSD